MVIHACNPSFQDAGESGLEIKSLPMLYSLLQANLGYIIFFSEVKRNFPEL